MKKIHVIFVILLLLGSLAHAQTPKTYNVIVEVEKTDSIPLADSCFNYILPIGNDSVMFKVKWQTQKEYNDALRDTMIQEKAEEEIKLPWWILFVVGALVLLGILVMLYVFYGERRIRNRIIEELSVYKKRESEQNQRQPSVTKIHRGQIVDEIPSSYQLKDADKELIVGIVLNKLREIEAKKEKEERKETPVTAEPQQPVTQQSQSLYADSIVEGKFNRVRKDPDDDTIFELKLKPDEKRASITIYEPIHKRILANHSFLEGCEKHILGGSTEVTILREGEAQKDENSGKWNIITPPEVKIS